MVSRALAFALKRGASAPWAIEPKALAQAGDLLADGEPPDEVVRRLCAAWLGARAHFEDHPRPDQRKHATDGFCWRSRADLNDFASAGLEAFDRLQRQRRERIEDALRSYARRVAWGDRSVSPTREGIADELREAGAEPGRERMDLALPEDQYVRALGFVEAWAMTYRHERALVEDRSREHERRGAETTRPATREQQPTDTRRRLEEEASAKAAFEAAEARWRAEKGDRQGREQEQDELKVTSETRKVSEPGDDAPGPEPEAAQAELRDEAAQASARRFLAGHHRRAEVAETLGKRASPRSDPGVACRLRS